MCWVDMEILSRSLTIEELDMPLKRLHQFHRLG